MHLPTKKFHALLLTWFDQHGRKHLPWQQNKTPYRVWISEIMLQQTQVNTVIPYYQRFMQQLPDLRSLAHAPIDKVLHLWAGLGYYTRARNLHRAAQIIMHDYAGHFPITVAELLKLPGIGKSTAGAIISLAFNQTAPILDGNVKRVLTRLYGIMEPINEKNTENHLWQLAEAHASAKRPADYTQAIMDLGATLCTRNKPQCPQCPFVQYCVAYQHQLTEILPTKKSANKLPTRDATFIIAHHKNKIYLQKRPPFGIWGGLWSLPELAGKPDKKAIQLFCRQHFQTAMPDYEPLVSFRHTFSHYHLNLHPVMVQIAKPATKVMAVSQQIWYNLAQPEAIGLPKPIATILRKLP